jgi:hypothetical protein
MVPKQHNVMGAKWFKVKMELIRVRQTPGGLRRTASIAPQAARVTQAELREQPGDK